MFIAVTEKDGKSTELKVRRSEDIKPVNPSEIPLSRAIILAIQQVQRSTTDQGNQLEFSGVNNGVFPLDQSRQSSGDYYDKKYHPLPQQNTKSSLIDRNRDNLITDGDDDDISRHLRLGD